MADPIPPGFEPVTRSGNFTAQSGPFYQRLEPDGSLRFGVLILDKHMNSQGVVHGGLLMSFMDLLLGRTVHHQIGRRRTATVQLDNQFLSPARLGDWIEGQGTIERQTRSLIFLSGRLSTGAQTVLTANGIWKIIGA